MLDKQIIVRFKGGLGNQLFQYALGRKLSLKHNCNLVLDISYYEQFKDREYRLNNYHVSCDFLNKKMLSYKLMREFKAINSYTEPHFQFDRNVFEIEPSGIVFPNLYLDGYWQSEKYFSDIRDILLADFTLIKPIQPRLQDYLNDITRTNAVAVHIRRGDYVSNPNANQFHGVIDIDWYKNAIDYVRSHIEQPTFFFFSDDIEFVKQHFSQQDNIFFIEASPDGFEQEDMYVMSCCKHNIIANSTFSWWGAWLNTNPNKLIIAPKQWFANKDIDTSDIIPSNWIRL